MSVYGQHKTFEGLGKPAIRLEFDTNDELVEFQKRMALPSEASPVEWDADLQMFTPVDGEELGAAGDLYLVRDMRTRSRKEPGELLANKNLRFVNLMDGKIKNFNKDLYYNTRSSYDEPKEFKQVAVHEHDGKYYITCNFFVPTAKFKDDPNAMAGRFDDVEVEADISKIYNIKTGTQADIDAEQAEKGNFDVYKNRFVGGKKMYGYITNDYYKELQQKAFYTLFKQIFNSSSSTPYTKKMFADFYANPTKYKIIRRSGYGDSKVPESWNKQYEGLKLNASGLGAPGDTYIITDTRERSKKDLDEIKALQRYKIEPYNAADTMIVNENGVIMFPVSELNFDTKNFQNRDAEFSEASVNRIIDAVTWGEFNWAIFDPITIWKNPDNGKYYVLSGHSRSEAFRRLAADGEMADGRNFEKIPAKIFNGTFEQAKELALNSNTLSTKETDLERANYYRERRNKLQNSGTKPSEIKKRLLDLARKNEGKNATKIIYLSYLNPQGYVVDAVTATSDGASVDKNRVAVMAEWVGHLRYDFPQLTNAHETELFEFLKNGHYGVDVKNFNDFAKRVQAAIEKHTEWGKFDASKSLNLERNLGKSENEKRFDAELARLKKEWTDADDLLTRKLGEFKARQKKDATITDAAIVAAARPYKDAALVAKANYLAFRDKRGDFLRADEKQLALFGRTAPAILYNNNDIMDCGGMSPTYQPLPDYSQFFAPADNATTLAGSGLNDTIKLIADTCRNSYKDCAKIAAYLKGDCKLQSAFNLWHWMRHNIRYEYDSEGKEEVRTPLRTWQDRKRGVDCDCLSVFAWCALYNMGYNPLFELAAFNGKPNFSHIYLNLDGIVVDRVWYVFNTRPPQVTGTAQFGVDMTKELIGRLF